MMQNQAVAAIIATESAAIIATESAGCNNIM
jgi:hypothetical protein